MHHFQGEGFFSSQQEVKCSGSYTRTPPSICILSHTDPRPIINEWFKETLRAVTTSSSRGFVFPRWQPPAGRYTEERGGGSGLFIAFSGPVKPEVGTLTHTGNGSAPSWMTKPSMTCVRTWGFTMACGGLFSPFCGVLPVTVGASLSFPEVMVGDEFSVAALGLLVEPTPEQEKKTFKMEQLM